MRDIVSGFFYLSDDAFRVGEYIDAGRAKGTVEGFTLRSLKLRHQNGQVHTMLVRFKFTARPGNPAMIQREAVKRMFNTLPGLGLEFAKEGATVILHTAPGAEAAKTASMVAA